MGTLIIMIIVLPFLALIPANIADKKGHSFAGFWVYGVLFFVLALIHAWMLDVDDLELERRALMSKTNRKCPACAEVIKTEARICRHCQTAVPPTDDILRTKDKPGS